MVASKSVRRIDIVKRVMETLKTPEVFKTINYKNVNESKIIHCQYPYLLKEVERLYEEHKNYLPETAKERAKKNLLWESNVNTIIHQVTFLGVQHRPDLVLQFEEGLKIAIEIKRGDDGKSVRDGLGQSITYIAAGFDFAVLLMIDISKESKILHSLKGEQEKRFIEKLWFENNILFDII